MEQRGLEVTAWVKVCVCMWSLESVYMCASSPSCITRSRSLVSRKWKELPYGPLSLSVRKSNYLSLSRLHSRASPLKHIFTMYCKASLCMMQKPLSPSSHTFSLSHTSLSLSLYVLTVVAYIHAVTCIARKPIENYVCRIVILIWIKLRARSFSHTQENIRSATYTHTQHVMLLETRRMKESVWWLPHCHCVCYLDCTRQSSRSAQEFCVYVWSCEMRIRREWDEVAAATKSHAIQAYEICLINSRTFFYFLRARIEL